MATFSGIPAQTCVGDIHIVGGKIGSFTDFLGASDLKANVANTIFVGPNGMQGNEDVLAEVILRVVASSTLFAKATENLAERIASGLVGLDLLATNT